MKNLMKFFALAVVILGFSAISFGQGSASATSPAATTTATIITPITISKTGDLNFGNIIADADGGTVTVTTNGTSSASGLTLPSATQGTITNASFLVSGLASATYSITLPDDITLSDGASHTMSVGTFVSDPTPTGTLDGGSETIKVGATLTVGASQAAGTYTNTSDLKVTVAYN